jgi:putative redox protein
MEETKQKAVSFNFDPLNVTLNLVNNKLHFVGNARFNESVHIDYVPPFGDNLGHTSLELLLMSLSSCVGSSILLLLRKMGKTINGLEVSAEGIRRNQHPTCFEKITLGFNLKSVDTDNAAIERAIKLSEDSLCPVWAMLKNNVEIVTEYSIVS